MPASSAASTVSWCDLKWPSTTREYPVVGALSARMALRGCGSSTAGRGFFMLAPCESPFGRDAAKRAGKFWWPALTYRPNAISIEVMPILRIGVQGNADSSGGKRHSHGRNGQEERASEARGHAEEAGTRSGR